MSFQFWPIKIISKVPPHFDNMATPFRPPKCVTSTQIPHIDIPSLQHLTTIQIRHFDISSLQHVTSTKISHPRIRKPILSSLFGSFHPIKCPAYVNREARFFRMYFLRKISPAYICIELDTRGSFA